MDVRMAGVVRRFRAREICLTFRVLALQFCIDLTLSLQPIVQGFPVLSTARLVDLLRALGDPVHACVG